MVAAKSQPPKEPVGALCDDGAAEPGTMVAPREPIRADNPTIVRPLAVALTLLVAAFSGSRAAGPADSPWDCAGPVGAAGTVPGGGKTWDCRAAETQVGVAVAGLAAAGSAALPGVGPAARDPLNAARRRVSATAKGRTIIGLSARIGSRGATMVPGSAAPSSHKAPTGSLGLGI